MNSFHVRFRLDGKNLVAEHDAIDNRKVLVRYTMSDIELITGSGRVIFMNDTANTAADSLVHAGITDIVFDPQNRHLFFGAVNVQFHQDDEFSFLNVDGQNHEWLCVKAKSAKKEEVKYDEV